MDAGVDAIGVLLQKDADPPKVDSDRLSIAAARDLVGAYRERLLTVLLVHETDAAEVAALHREIRPNALQIQTSIPPGDLAAIKSAHPDLLVIKTFHVVEGANARNLLHDIRDHVDRRALDVVLLDSRRGGSGSVHDWAVSAEIVRLLGGVPVLLAGGLNPNNVAAALQQVRPWGVDVMTGVTSEKRSKKDPDKIWALVRAARGSRTTDTSA